jgi:hypothetical protein
MSEIERVRIQRDNAQDAIREILLWIDNWSPNFELDDDWPETRAKVEAALLDEPAMDAAAGKETVK